MAEDSQHDVVAAQRAWKMHGIQNPLHVVGDGDDCLDYLHQRGKYDASNAPRPGVLLLDLRMPKTDGLAVLRHVRQDPDLKRLPVIVLTTSRAEKDKVECYDSGANAYVIKPIGFQNFAEAMRAISSFWDLVELPT
jgi:CheY-like chemotaxis protein